MTLFVTNKYFSNSILPHTKHEWDRQQMADDKATKALGFAPTIGEPWCEGRMAAALLYLDQRAAGLTREHAGRLATHIWTGMVAHPDADQLTLVVIENGSASVHSTASLDLGSGYICGGYLATALVVDVRNLRARVQRAVEASARVIGDDDEA